MDQPRFLDANDVLMLLHDTLEREGGKPGVRDLGLLDSAVAMPRQQFGGQLLHPTLGAMAAAYLFHICRNHPFVDGNKRAAALSALVFLDQNGVDLLPEPDDLERLTLGVASGAIDKDQCVSWFERYVGEQDA